MGLSNLDKAKVILCPKTPQAAKLANKFIGLMYKAHEALDLIETLVEYPTWEPGTTTPFVNNVEDADFNESDDLSFTSNESYTEAEQ